jgi:hypothetical protein
MSATMTAEVAAAIDELEEAFGSVKSEPDGEGGAYVTVLELDIGERWLPSVIPLTFQLAFNYPHAAVYPYFAPGDLRRADGGARPGAMQQVEWRGSARVQISLRANAWSPAHDSAAGAVAQVRHYLKAAA